MTALRIRRVALTRALCVAALLGGCVSPAPYERESVTLERIALRDAWLETAASFGVVLVLVLFLIVIHYNRTRLSSLAALFRRFTLRDLDAARRSWQARRAAAASRRAAERERRRAEALICAPENQQRLVQNPHAQPMLGPPTLSFLARFGVGLASGLGCTMLGVLMVL